jgi:hypothetical protein
MNDNNCLISNILMYVFLLAFIFTLYQCDEINRKYRKQTSIRTKECPRIYIQYEEE